MASFLEMDKKERELLYFAAFRSACPKVLDDDFEHADNPDFVCHRQSLGIEVTELCEERRRQRESLIERLRRGVEHDLREASFARLYVTVHIKPSARLTKGRLDEISAGIGNVGKRFGHSLHPGQQTEVPAAFLPEGVHRLEVWHNKRAAGPRCLVPQSDWELLLTPELLQGLLDEKNTRVREYRQKARTLWLLIANHGGVLSGSYSIDTNVSDSRYDTRFDKTFLFALASNSVIELRSAAGSDLN